MEHECGKNKVSMVFFLLTDIKHSSSEMLYAGEHAREMIMNAFPGAVPTDGGFKIDGLLSRKNSSYQRLWTLFKAFKYYFFRKGKKWITRGFLRKF